MDKGFKVMQKIINENNGISTLIDDTRNNNAEETTDTSILPGTPQPDTSPHNLAGVKLRIAHSSDPEDADVLVRFKLGRYTVKSAHDAKRPTKIVRIPKRDGRTEEILRCARPKCAACASTANVNMQLTGEATNERGIGRVQTGYEDRQTEVKEVRKTTTASHDLHEAGRPAWGNLPSQLGHPSLGLRGMAATPPPSFSAINTYGPLGGGTHELPMPTNHDHFMRPPQTSYSSLAAIAQQGLFLSGDYAPSPSPDNDAAPTIEDNDSADLKGFSSLAEQHGVTRDGLDAAIKSLLSKRDELDAELSRLFQLHEKLLG